MIYITINADQYSIDDDGNFVYMNTGETIGKYDWNTGELVGLDGNSMGRIVLNNDGSMNYTTEKGNSFDGSYKDTSSNGAPPPGGPPSGGPPSGAGTPVFRFTIDHSGTGGGIDTYMVDSDGNLVYMNTGETVAKYDWNTGMLTGADGRYMGSLTFYDDGSMNYTTEKGNSFDGNYSGSPSQPKDPINITPGQPSTWNQGIDWSSRVPAALLEQLLGTAAQMEKWAEEAGQQAQDYYTNQMNQSMGVQGFQGLMNELGGRNMLSSSVTENAMANAQMQQSQAIADKAFSASLASTQAKMGVPGILSGIIAQLGGRQGSQTNPYSGYDYLLRLLGY